MGIRLRGTMSLRRNYILILIDETTGPSGEALSLLGGTSINLLDKALS